MGVVERYFCSAVVVIYVVCGVDHRGVRIMDKNELNSLFMFQFIYTVFHLQINCMLEISNCLSRHSCKCSFLDVKRRIKVMLL